MSLRAQQLSIRMLLRGCRNRHFFHIIVAPVTLPNCMDGIEQLGVYDPMPNEHGELLVAINMERFKYYVAKGAWVRTSVAGLLGAAGVMPIHPHSLEIAWIYRRRLMKMKEAEKNAKSQEINT